MRTLFGSKERSNSRKKQSKCKKSNRRPSIPDKSLTIASKVYSKSRTKKTYEGSLDGRKSLTCKRNYETAHDMYNKPPLKTKHLEEAKKPRKKREDHIVRLNKKKKTTKGETSELMNSMSTTLHPVLQLADESIRKINNQLNYNSLHHNSV